jgi:hypothetical protein
MQNADKIKATRRWRKQFALRLKAFKEWSSLSTLILIVTVGMVIAVLILSPYLSYSVEGNSNETLLRWFHWLATIALCSTALWSIFAFVGVYFGPHALWKHSKELGAEIFFVAGSFYLVGVGIYIFAIQQVWSDKVRNNFACKGIIEALYYGVHNHIALIVVTEALFWLFDFLIIRKINKLEADWKSQAIDASTYMWAIDLRHQLRAWIYYVDRPATFAFLLLLLSGIYLEYQDVLLNHLETEMFTSGAVFFSLMTTNLAFYAANRQNPEPSIIGANVLVPSGDPAVVLEDEHDTVAEHNAGEGE